MQIKELIAILQKHPNPEAEINFVANLVNPEEPMYDVQCDVQVLDQDKFFDSHIEICVYNECEEDMLFRQNFLSVDNQIARDSYGDFFSVGEEVGHEGADNVAIIQAFSIDKDSEEVLVHTTRGTAHLDFLVKLFKDETI